MIYLVAETEREAQLYAKQKKISPGTWKWIFRDAEHLCGISGKIVWLASDKKWNRRIAKAYEYLHSIKDRPDIEFEIK